MTELLKTATEEWIAKVQKIKEDVVIEMAKSKGITIDLEEEKSARFKSIVIEHDYGKESWYYNDGTKDGVRIVTFEKKERGIDSFIKGDFEFGISYHYY